MSRRNRPNKQSPSTSSSAAPPTPAAGAIGRYPLVDALRGVAIMLMFAYHFTFDLNHFGAVRIDFNYDPRWLAFRAVIVSFFVGLVGVGLVLADRYRPDWRGFTRRLGAIGGCALLATAGSFVMFRDSYIFFGILHFIFVASVLGILFRRLFRMNLLLGVLMVIVGMAVKHPVFDKPWLQWYGLMTFKPNTQDYVPLLPWFGAVLIGMFLARLAQRSGLLAQFGALGAGNPIGRFLAFAGRHSLLIYMVHQPIFIGCLWAFFQLFPRTS